MEYRIKLGEVILIILVVTHKDEIEFQWQFNHFKGPFS